MDKAIKVWCFGKNGKLIVGNVEVRDMEQARRLAREWNRGGNINHIEIVQNARDAREATQVSAIY
jgi:hypothetical protein